LYKSDINKSISEYRTEKQEHKFEQRQLQINGRIIADNIDSAEKDIIFIKIDNVFKKASAILLELLATRNELDSWTGEINNMAKSISKLIEIGEYETKASCCPTIWRLIKRYVL
jgi:hypothetical protein